jgi:hypothetical protein
MDDTTRELNHQKQINLELKQKYEEQTRQLNNTQEYVHNLLHKIYEIFQNSDKHKLFSEMRNLYIEYINDNVVKNFENMKVNPSVKNELTRQIDFLQSSIDTLAEIKDKKDNIKRHEISMKTKQNAELIFHLNDMKKHFTLMEKENISLKNQNFTLNKTIEILKKRQGEEAKNNRLAQSMGSVEGLKGSSEGLILPDIVEQKGTNSTEFFKLDTITKLDNLKKGKNGIKIDEIVMRGKLFRGSVVDALKKNDENVKISEILVN